MAAVIDLHTGRRLPEVKPPVRPVRPVLRLVHGGRSPRVRSVRRTFLVRRAIAAVTVVVLLLVATQVLGAVVGTAVESAVGAFEGPPAASAQVHVVAPGETLWSVAGRLAPGVDRRVAIDDLLALNGGAPLRVGQRLRLPASFD